MRRFFIAGWMFCFVPLAQADESRMDQFFAPGNVAEYNATVEPATNGAPALIQQNGRVNAMMSRSENDTWTAGMRAAHVELSHSPIIPETGLIVPDSLWNVQGSFSYLHKQGDRRQWGAIFAVGSASDKLFYSFHETEIQTTGSYMIPSGTRNAWLFLLNYSNNRAFLSNIPLPGVAYIWRKPDLGLQAVIGFPFLALNYRPNRDWSAGVTLFGTTNQSLEVARRVKGPLRAYVRFERSPLLWLRAGRDTTTDHLIYDEKKAMFGLRSPLGAGWSFDIAGARTFDRRFFEAKDAGHSNVSRASLANGWLMMGTLTWRWGMPEEIKEGS